MTVNSKPPAGGGRAAPEPELTFRDTAPQDAPALVQCAQTAFGSSWPEDFFQWKYFQNPAGRIFGRCAQLDGRPAAFYGNIPVRLKVGGQAVTAAQAVDAMVAPEARRRGVWVTLARETQRQMDQAGVALAYAFPNPVSLAGFVGRLGWTPAGSVPRFVRVLDIRTAARAGAGASPARWIYALWLWALSRRAAPGAPAIDNVRLSIKAVESFDERFDELWEAVSTELPIAVVRDSVYLNWRYARHPVPQYVVLAAERDGRLAGYAVLSTRDVQGAGVAAVTELLVAPGDSKAGLALLAESIQYARSAQCAQLQSWLLPQHMFYRRLLEQSGFVFRPVRHAPGMLRYSTPFIIRPNPVAHFSPDPAVLENWYLTMGDYDYF